MYNYGIVIKPTTVSVEDGRRALGEVLIDCGECDWYMTGTYREKVFLVKTSNHIKKNLKIII